MNSNWDKYLDPPDFPETPICEVCGQDMPILDDFGGQKYVECVNSYCPDKHTGFAHVMALHIVDQAETIDRLKTKIRRLELVNKCP